MCLVYKCRNELLPQYLAETFINVSDKHGHHTKAQSHQHLYTSTYYGDGIIQDTLEVISGYQTMLTMADLVQCKWFNLFRLKTWT